MLESLKAIYDNVFAATLLPAMVAFAALDFLSAVVGNLRAGTFTFLLVGKWVGDKGVPIISVAILYIAGAAATSVTLPTGETDLSGLFAVTASTMAAAFIATQIASIMKNLGAPPQPEQPVGDEATGA
jgi:hypothetical protein